MKIGEKDQKVSSKTIQLVSFTLGKEEYGVHIDEVESVIRMPEITHLPQTADFIKGVINLRGDVIPVVDMRDRFKMEKKEWTETTRVIVVKVEAKSVGLIVDTVSQVVNLSEEEIEEAPDIISGLAKEYIEGIGKTDQSMIIILRIGKILTAEEIKKIDKMTKVA